MEDYPSGCEPDSSIQIDPVEASEPAEPYTIYTHPGLRQYTPDELAEENVYSSDWELLRLLQSE